MGGGGGENGSSRFRGALNSGHDRVLEMSTPK